MKGLPAGLVLTVGWTAGRKKGGMERQDLLVILSVARHWEKVFRLCLGSMISLMG